MPKLLIEKQVDVTRQDSNGLQPKDVNLRLIVVNKTMNCCNYLKLKFYIQHVVKLSVIQRVILLGKSG